MAVSKNVTITEGKTVNFRVDIANILNHATPSGSAPFTYDQRNYSPGNPLAGREWCNYLITIRILGLQGWTQSLLL